MTMAKTQKQFMNFKPTWTPALELAKEEAELQRNDERDGIQDDLQAWDWRYYTEK